MDKELFLEVCKHGLAWYVLGSLISYDSNLTEEDNKKNIAQLQLIREHCDEPELIMTLGDMEVGKICDFCDKGLASLKEELNERTK